MSKVTTLKKPTLSRQEVREFAEGATGAPNAPGKGKALGTSQNAPTGLKSGLVPEGDIHIALKIRAAQERTTVGELIENWVEGWR